MYNDINGFGFKIINRIHFLMMKIIGILNSIVLIDEWRIKVWITEEVNNWLHVSDIAG